MRFEMLPVTVEKTVTVSADIDGAQPQKALWSSVVAIPTGIAVRYTRRDESPWTWSAAVRGLRSKKDGSLGAEVSLSGAVGYHEWNEPPTWVTEFVTAHMPA